MDIDAWLGLSSLAISLGVLVFGAIQYKQTAKREQIADLERELAKCETERADLRAECARLTRVTMDLVIETRRLADERLNDPEDGRPRKKASP